MLALSPMAAPAATVTVDFGTPAGTQQMTWGTNEIPGHLRPSTIATARLAEINSRCVRYWLGGDVRPSSGSWNWAELDQGVDRIVAAKATPMICFAGIPEWMAQTPYPGKPHTWHHPRDLNEWASYCVAVVQHCANRGRPVEQWYWEIWNEPNNGGVSGSWSTQEYLALYDAAAVALRAAFPGIRIGGPSVDHPSEHWIIPLLQGHDVQFITWHRYGAWDPTFGKSTASYLAETNVFGSNAALVEGWIDANRPGEGILNVCGELNLNAYCCGIDDRIWEPMMIPWYASAMRHLLLNGCDVEQFFVGTDKSWPGFGLFVGTGPDAGWRSPAFHAKRLFTAAARPGSQLVANQVSGSSVLEALATRIPTGLDCVMLINKTHASTPATMNVTGLTVAGGIWYTVDQPAPETITTVVVSGGNQQSRTLSGYALSVLEVCPPGVACVADRDADGLLNLFDNCPNAYNPAQTDGDQDGVADACDPCPSDPLNDADGDGRCANADNCPSMANPGQEDTDHDNTGDLCDNCPATPNASQADADEDGVGDACDLCPGTPPGGYITANGCPTPRADFNRDGDVDQEDFGYLQSCLSGPGVVQQDPHCQSALLDNDEDVDAADVVIFQRCQSGAGNPADPQCED
ncbi:MAG: hypothetical protein AMXMBFR13_36250 [Phycisphaerae bacterium]